jgi:hypothetical protein
MTGLALPNGHTASDRRVRLHQFGERQVHCYAANKPDWRQFVKKDFHCCLIGG